MIILAIDPGSEKSAWLLYDFETKLPKKFGMNKNDEFLHRFPSADEMVIEMVASYGMAVGKSVFETCVWIGRFMQEWKVEQGKEAIQIYRKDVKMHLCNSMRAKDSNIRQVLIDKFGGTRETAIGTKKNPKALYGIKKDLWSALSLAIYYAETTHGGID